MPGASSDRREMPPREIATVQRISPVEGFVNVSAAGTVWYPSLECVHFVAISPFKLHPYLA